MGKIADLVQSLILQGAKGREIVAAVAKAEEEQQPKAQPFKEEFEVLWLSFPHKVAKPAAQKAYVAARRRGIAAGTIADGMLRYINEKPIDRPWMMLSTFCNQDRWTDQPAPVFQQPKGSDYFDLAGDYLATRTGAGSSSNDRGHVAGISRIAVVHHREHR